MANQHSLYVLKGRERKNAFDYRDLNIASPKDYFSLSHNDVLVDYMVDHVIFSFMDGFSKYNRDSYGPGRSREKFNFIYHSWETFCYKVMRLI